MILLIAMDTYYNFRFFSMRDEEGKKRVCGRQLVCMFMLHFLANILIWLNTESVTMLGDCFTGTVPDCSSTICVRFWRRDLLSSQG